MDDQIVLADKTLRRRVLIGILIFIPIGGYLIHFLSGYLEGCKALAGTDVELAITKVKDLLAMIAIVNAFISSGFTLYFLLIGIRIFKSEQYPPKDMRVIKDTKRLTGKKAKATAMGYMLIAVISLSSNVLMWHLHRIVDMLVPIK